MLIRRLLATLVIVSALFVARAEAAPASDFTLRDVNGRSVSLSAYKGKVIVVSFWATWCGPCKEEMTHLQKLYADKSDEGLVILSISTDDARTASKVKPYITSKGYTFPVLLDASSSVVRVYNPAKTLPMTVVIGRDFELADTHTGFNPGDEVKLAALVDKLLGAK
jgi:peroxiredoxin